MRARALAALPILAAAWLSSVPLRADPPPTSAAEEAIRKDQAAALRYLQMRFQRQEGLIKRGREAEAEKLEAECLRQEAKCLERYLWYMRHDDAHKSKAKALGEKLAELKKKDPKSSLEERRKAGFKPSELVANPFGLATPPPEPPKSRVRSFDSISTTITVNKPARSIPGDPSARFEGAKPPPGSDSPPPPDDAGSAGSGGSGSDHR